MNARTRGAMVLAACAILMVGCGSGDPGAIGPNGIDGLSAEGQRQEYVDGASRALQQLGTATQGASFAAAVDAGNARQLKAAALAWQQGGQQLKGLNPPKSAVPGHTALVKAVDALNAWNQRIVAAAPNKAATKRLATQASNSPASHQFEEAICQLVDAGFEVIPDTSVCSPVQDSSAGG